MIKKITDYRGSLYAINTVPFEVKRIFFLRDVTLPRGQHAHKTLKEVLIAVNGSCLVDLDYGDEVKHFWLDSPEKSIIIPPLCWRTLRNFSDDCIILSLCSEILEESDYIRDYDEFKDTIKQLS